MIDLATDPATRIIAEAERIIRDALDDFAGTGWGVALQRLGIEEHGVEIMPEAVATRDANGMRTIYRDVWDGLLGWERTPAHQLYLSSPPCQTFSVAGSGDGRRALDDVLAAVERGDWRDPSVLFDLTRTTDPRTALVLVPLARVFQNLPLYVAFEQVPQVLPVWEACAEILRAMGYSVWTGNLQAEQYGVPQTRKRAILIARRDGIAAAPPPPTHSRFYSTDPTRLDEGVLPWISMASALGVPPEDLLGFPRRADGGEVIELGGVAYRARDLRSADKPAHHLTEKARSWRIVAAKRQGAGRVERHGERPPRELEQPAFTIRGSAGGMEPGGFRWEAREGVAGSARLTLAQAATLQTYPAGFKFEGSQTKRFLQVGNAVPPLMAEAIIRGFLP